ncbi:MAG: hypothetical protein R3E36_07885 [Nitrosomonas sp.]|nr:hypothetical protein [Nitrosomonas sp.]
MNNSLIQIKTYNSEGETGDDLKHTLTEEFGKDEFIPVFKNIPLMNDEDNE